MNEILTALAWSAPRREGSRFVQVAPPSGDFWAIWRSDKAAVKEAGIRVRPAVGGWEVVRNSESAALAPDAAPVAELPVVADASPLPAAAARRIPGFEPCALDDSRKWSGEQLAIFHFFRQESGNLEVIARAGTGKTTTIKGAFSQAPEESMLYAVFNKKNQLEAEQSIADARVEIKTLHAVGYRLIRMMWHNSRPDDNVEKDRAFQVLGRNAPDEVAAALVKLVGFAKNQFVSPTLEQLVSLADARDIDVSEFDCPADKLARFALRVLDLSKNRDSQGRISFNDMVWLPVAANWVKPLFDLVCVDEAQDMNLPQLLMAKGLVRQGGRVIVVGDDRQAIYGFRGAAQDGLAMMQKLLNAQVLPLTITYRCPKTVVAEAAKLVPDYRAADSAPEGIIRTMGDSKILDVVAIGDAILSRANAPLMPLCLRLLRKGISARIEGRDIGKSLAAIVKKLRAKSIPHFIERVETWGDKQKSRFKHSEHFDSKCELINDQVACLIAVAEGLSSVAEIEPRLLAMFQDSDGFQKPAVVLSSVHKAKGLEWNRVFLLSKTFKNASKGGEEANIFYVAITRAKAELVHVYDEKPAEGGAK